MTNAQRLQQANAARQRTERTELARNGINSMANRLTSTEAQELVGCEEVIENGLNIWYQVGEALLHIRDKRLYREKFGTFEEYCRERWQMTRRNANYLIEAADVRDGLGKIFPKDELPQRASQASALTGLAPEEQEIIWGVVQQTAPNGKVTAEHVKSVVTVLKEVTQTGAIDNGEGESIPVTAATIEHVKAAVTEETYERQRRQEAHIAEKQERKGTPAALLSSDSNEWYTPPVYLEAVRAVLGTIDIDPASNAEANTIVQARAFYDTTANGLKRDWTGRVFLNPPYGKEEGESMSNQALWSARLISQYQQGITTEAILLVNAITDAGWFQPLWDYPICFTDHRIPFYRPGGEAGKQPVRGSVFVYFGANVAEFASVFRRFGAVVLSALRGKAS